MSAVPQPTLGGPQFDPAAERHHLGFVVKVVNPGCTLEVQIEEADGRVTRVTTTDDPHADRMNILYLIESVTSRFLANNGI